MLLKSTVCNESACCYSGEISEEDEVVIKHCDLWMSGARCLRGTHWSLYQRKATTSGMCCTADWRSQWTPFQI